MNTHPVMTHSIANWLRNAKPMRHVETDKVSSTGTIVDGENLGSAKHAPATFSYLYVPNQPMYLFVQDASHGRRILRRADTFSQQGDAELGVRCFRAGALTVFVRGLEGASVEKSTSTPLFRIWKGERPTHKVSSPLRSEAGHQGLHGSYRTI